MLNNKMIFYLLRCLTLILYLLVFNGLNGVKAMDDEFKDRSGAGKNLQLDEKELDELSGLIQYSEKHVQAQIRDSLSDITKVLVLGITGSGKSTLVHSLAGIQSTVKKGGSNFELHIDDHQLLPGMTIGHGLSSATTMPVSWYDKHNQLVYWDCPGFMDSRGSVQDIVNILLLAIYFLHQVGLKPYS